MEMRKKSKKMYTKRIMALMMAFIMVFSVSTPTFVFADYEDENHTFDSSFNYESNAEGSQDGYGDITLPGYDGAGYGGDIPGVYEPSYGGDNEDGYNDGYGDGYGYGNNDGYGDGYNDDKYDYDYKDEYEYKCEEEDEEELQLIAAFGSGGLIDYVTITSWDLICETYGLSMFANPPREVAFATRFRLTFTWEILMPQGQEIQAGDTFSLYRPLPEVGVLGFPNADWHDLEDDNGIVLGRWRIHNGHIEKEFNATANGLVMVSGSTATGYTITNNVTRGGIQDVTFAGEDRPVNFQQRPRTVQTTIQTKSSSSASATRLGWQMDLNILGLRQLTGQTGWPASSPPPGPLRWGQHFTTLQGFFVEDDLNGRFESASFVVRTALPYTMEPDHPSFGFGTATSAWTSNFNSHMTRIIPLAGENRDDFRDRVQLAPFQWGVWQAPTGEQTLMAYFGVLGADAASGGHNLRMSDINANFHIASAQWAIYNGFFEESDRAALEEYFWNVYGNGNVIGGRLPFVRVNFAETFDPVAVRTPITNVMRVYVNGTERIVPNHVVANSATRYLEPMISTPIPDPMSARILLTERSTPTAIVGAQFQLQRLDGATWVDVTNRGGVNGVFTTNASGRTENTLQLLPGTYRFIQINNGTTAGGVLFDRTISDNDPYYCNIENTVVRVFTIVTDQAGQEIPARNVRSPQFLVNYDTLTPVRPPSIHWSEANPLLWAPPESVLHQAGSTVTIAPAPATVTNQMHNGVLGTFTWVSGWTVTEPAGVIVSGSGNNQTFVMPNQPVTIMGEWVFTASQFNVSYAVTGPAPATFTPSPLPATASHAAGSTVTVAQTLTSTYQYNAAGVRGSWAFSGWTTTSAGVTITGTPGTFIMPNNNVSFTGTWTFTPAQFEVSYEVTGSAPATFTPSPLPGAAQHAAGGAVTVAQALTSTYQYNAGVRGSWTFSGWTAAGVNITGTPGTFTMPNNNVTLTGTWTFTPAQFSVSYEVTGDARPATFTFSPSPLPATASHAAGSTVTVAQTLTSTYQYNAAGVRGSWAFSGWATTSAGVTVVGTPGTFTMPNNNVVFTGTWTFTADQFNVSYEVSGDARPATFTFSPSPLPSATPHAAGSTVNVASTLTSTYQYNAAGVRGSWVFSGWTTANATVTAGSFTMPNNDVVFTGTWTFTADQFNVSYEVSGDSRPATFTFSPSPLPATASHAAGSTVNVASTLISTYQYNAAGVRGSWAFSGWATTSAGVTVAGTPGTFTMPNNNVVFTGTWTFTADQFNVSYEVSGDARPATFTFSPSPLPSATPHAAGSTVNVASTLISTYQYNAAGVRGSWAFTGWTTTSAGVNVTGTPGTFTMPNNDVVFTGTWTFTADQFNVSYEVSGDARPATFTFSPSPLPSATPHAAGSTVNVAQTLTSTYQYNAAGVRGSWAFTGWTTTSAGVNVTGTPGTFTMPNNDVVFTGTWTFTADQFNVSYEVTGEIPATFAPSPLPATASHAAGSTVNVAQTLTSTYQYNAAGVRGSWAFTGWTTTSAGVNVTGTPGTFTMPNNNVVFTGTWTFTADQFNVSYEVTGEAPATFAPSPLPPTVSNAAGSTVNVASTLTSTYQYNAAGVRGSWVFSGWTTANATVTAGSFTMPNNDVVFTGTWTFTADQFNVSYEVTGPAPATFTPSPLPPTVSNAAGSTVNVAQTLTSTYQYNAAGVQGSWVFSGWTTANATVTAGSFTMPNHDVVFTGTWTFTADQFNVSYEVTGEAPATFAPSPLPSVASHAAGETVNVAQTLTSTYQYNAAGAQGSWTFSGWATANATVTAGSFTMPNNNVVFTGTWTFTPAQFNVSYEVTGPAPATFTPSPLPPTVPHDAGSAVNVAQTLTSTYQYNAAGLIGAWHFSGWTTVNATVTAGSFTMPNNDVVFTGTWTFVPVGERPVTYVVNEDATYGSPDSTTVTPTVPSIASVAPGATHTRIAALETTAIEAVCGTLGQWVFSGWTVAPATVTVAADGTFTMPNDDVTFTGSWGFMPNNSYDLIYTVEGISPDTFTPEVPEKASVQHGATVMVADNLTTTSNTHAGRRGTWRFSGWTTEDVTVISFNGTFTMPEHEVAFTGYWTFTPQRTGNGGPNPPIIIETPPTPLEAFVEDHIWYVRGFPDGSFRPGQSITRAEMTMILFRLLYSADKYTPRGNNFSDVSTGWYAQAVSYLAFRNIVRGYPDGTFRPNAPITRAELTAVMSRFFELADGTTHNFTDVNDNHWAIRYIINAVNRGWVIGFEDDTFRPDNATTRAEAVTLINRVLARRPNPVTIRNKLYPHLEYYFDMQRLFNDITSTHWAYYDIMEAAVEHLYTMDDNGLEIWSELYIPWLEGRVPFNH